MTRLRWLAIASLWLCASAYAQNPTPGPSGSAAAKPANAPALDRRKLSYAMGYKIGSQLNEGVPDVDLPTLLKALQDAYAKHQPAVSMQEMHAQLEALDQQMHDQAVSEWQRMAAANIRKSADFLARNRALPGVVQLPSGIQYNVLKRGGGGQSPAVTSTVTVNYRGMLVDGTEFDSSWAHGAPVNFTVNKVIRGWQDVIPRMHVGDRWKVVIPSALAYGELGQLPRIGPNEVLVFEIELLAIKQP